jgi:orotidine-5'-phosphate decarboxylase
MRRAGRERLIFALDVPSLDEAERWVARLSPHVGLFKVGLELFAAAGPDAVRAVVRRSGRGVFLDVKLHDIPATVERAARALSGLEGLRMLTVHAEGGEAMLRAAAKGAGPSIQVLAVTRLTSLEAPADLVTRAASLARETGCGGVVCSGLEAAFVRAAVGPDLAIVCPGVRPEGSDPGDQARAVTPAQAIRAGADYLVVGRPIRDSRDPERVALEIAREVEGAA